MSSKLEDIANKVAVNYKNGDKEAAFDPSMLFTIMDIIGNLVGMFKGCGKTAPQAIQSAKSPNFWEKQAVRRSVRQHLGGFKAMRREGENLVDAVLKTGGDLTVKDVEDLYKEVE